MYKGYDNQLTFSRNSAGQKGVALYIKSNERKKRTAENTLPGKVIIQI